MKTLNLLGWITLLCYLIAVGIGIYIAFKVWEIWHNLILIGLAFVAVAYLLHQAINKRESKIKEKEQREAEAYEDEYRNILDVYIKEEKRARGSKLDEVEWRKLKWFEFMGRGFLPKEANHKARELTYKVEQ